MTWHGPSRGARGAVPFVHDFGSRREKVQHLDGELWTFAFFSFWNLIGSEALGGVTESVRVQVRAGKHTCPHSNGYRQTPLDIYTCPSIPSAVVGADGPPYGIPGTGSTIDVRIGIAYLASSKSRLLVIFVL